LCRPPNKLPSRPYLIGLTGGSGSGKSSIAAYLSTKPSTLVIDCDRIAHEVYRKGTPLYSRLVDEFGQGILEEDTKEIARRELGKVVFSNHVK
jgi:phosphopantetheine adenylyltransferase/dephospho-CoA kinase